MNDSILRSRRILIKRIEDGKVVADTKIIRFDKYRNICFIAADSLTDKGNYSVTVLLGRHKEKEDRQKHRYAISTKGVVSELCFGDREVKLNRPMALMTVNMSSKGILVRMDSGSLEKGDCFRMSIRVDGRNLTFFCVVVRIQNDDMLTEEYGCEIVGTQFEVDAEG